MNPAETERRVDGDGRRPGETRRGWAGRFLLVVLAVWGLAMVVPDAARLVRPLGSFGLYANNDGVIVDVRGPFARDADSPAWRAGLRRGERLDLKAMRCVPLRTLVCASAQAALGGLRLVTVGRQALLILSPRPGGAPRSVHLVARSRPFSWWVMAVLPLDLLAAVAVILAAAWLVWTRPTAMSWGFFLYVIWFNPGSADQYYALLQRWPAALLAQNLAGAVAQGAGYAGFLLFALRAPRNQGSPEWRWLEGALGPLAVLLSALLAAGYANLFGAPTEILTRIGSLAGVAVAAGALAILLGRRPGLSALDNQRLWWVIWGCLIGLPAFVLADLGQSTSLLAGIRWAPGLPEGVWGLVSLLNGVLCLFVFEAVRRPRVVSVAIPLRRVTLLGLILSAPALLLHEQVDRVRESVVAAVRLPGWAWLPVAVLALFLISRLHESAVRLLDRQLRRPLARAGRELAHKIVEAREVAAAEEALTKGAAERFHLASALLFRKGEGGFALACVHGWAADIPPTLSLGHVEVSWKQSSPVHGGGGPRSGGGGEARDSSIDKREAPLPTGQSPRAYAPSTPSGSPSPIERWGRIDSINTQPALERDGRRWNHRRAESRSGNERSELDSDVSAKRHQALAKPSDGEVWRPFEVDEATAARNGWPEDPGRPVFAVPVADRWRCYAIALYGPHLSGADLNPDERAILADLADRAAAVYRELDNARLRRDIERLQRELERRSAIPGALET